MIDLVAASTVLVRVVPVDQSPSQVATGYWAIVAAARAPAGSEDAREAAYFAAVLVGEVYWPAPNSCAAEADLMSEPVTAPAAAGTSSPVTTATRALPAASARARRIVDTMVVPLTVGGRSP